MIECKLITDKSLFDTFVENHIYTHYQKTSTWGEYRVNYCGDEAYLMIGAFDEQQLVGTAMVTITRRKGIGKVAYVAQGLCIDYQNKKLVHLLIDAIHRNVKPYKVTCLKMDFNVKRCLHAIDGSVIEGEDNQWLTDFLVSMGFKHRGYGYAYDGSWANRFTLIAPVSKDKYEKTVQKSLMQAVNRQLKTGLIVRDGCDEDLRAFVKAAQALGDKKHFTADNETYFSNYINANKPYSVFKIAEIDYELKAKIFEEELNSSKVRRNPELLASVQRKYEQAVADVNAGKTKEILGGAIYMRIGNMLFDPYTYTFKEHNEFKAAACLHIATSRQYVPMGVDYLDFVGFAGNTDVNDPYYGLYDFKSKFGSEFVEYIGEFDYVYKKNQYNTDKTLRKLKSWIKHHA